jgi:hypothetical protein
MAAPTVTISSKPVTVTVKSTGQRIIVSSPQVKIVTAGRVGATGPQGDQGPAGTPRLEIPFSFGDATPAELFIAEAGKLVQRITLFIETAFDGSNPVLTVGDVDESERLMAAFENNPSEAAAYQVTPNLRYVSDTQVLLFITPGLGASQGSGLVVVEMQT